MNRVKTYRILCGPLAAVLIFSMVLAGLPLGGRVALAAPGDTVRASTSSAGIQGDYFSKYPSITPDGRYVAFTSRASNLVEGDTNSGMDVFRKDLETGQTLLVSTSSSGAQGNGESLDPSISSDGRYVAFWSKATNLVEGDTNGVTDIFRKDITTGQTLRASTSSSGAQGDSDDDKPAQSLDPSISSDGRYVAFYSEASSLVEGNRSPCSDIFRKDLTTGQTVLVSTSSSGAHVDGYSLRPSISSDGRYVAFASTADNLVGGDTSDYRYDIFRKDLTTGETLLVSTSSSGAQGDNGNWGCDWPSISSGGRYVAFNSDTTNLVEGDTNGERDIFRKDLTTGQTLRVSTSSSGAQGKASSFYLSISSDGRYVAFHSGASNLVEGDTNGCGDVFRKDLSTGQTLRVSTSSSGAQGNNDSFDASISSDGKYVAFDSDATNLVEGDTNSGMDVFRKDVTAKPKPSASATWYLAEGTSDYGFDTYVTIQNTNDKAVTAQVTYMTKGGQQKRPDITLPPMSQTVLNPRDALGATDFSTKVVCKEGKTIAVDRRMTWTGPGAASPEGHSSVGVTSPAKTWYLPEGSSRWGFETWLLIQNPGDKDASVTVTYMIEGEAPVEKAKTVKASSRSSFNMETDIGQKDASIKVESSTPVIPERAMYRNNRREGHCSIGTTTPAKDFYLAEGTTDWGFTTYVLVQNPNPKPTTVNITYMTPTGPVPQTAFTMDPNSRKTITVNSVPGMSKTDCSIHVAGSAPIIAERAMYWTTAAGEACHDSIGMDSPHTTFYLPDGEAQNGMETWTLVQNPNSSAVTVEVTYMTPDGKGNVVKTETVKANSRRSFSMAEHSGINGRAAIMVESKTAGKKIMVERAMYWGDRGAGTDTIGGFSD